MENATHAVITGMMVDYFKFGLNPARDGKNAEALVPISSCPNASEHLEGLKKLCSNIEKKVSSLSALDGALNSFAFAIPTSGSHVFGSALHGDAVTSKECWGRRCGSHP
jgi:hypothetical protein